MFFLLAILWMSPTQSNPSGSIAGKVVWVGQPPVAPPFRAPINPGVGQPNPGLQSWPNKLVPRVNAGGGVADVLVWLEGDAGEKVAKGPERAGLRVIVEENQIRLEQGGKTVPVGLVNPGDTVEVESKQANLFILRGRGVASFSIPLVDPAKPVQRKLEKSGWVELSSGSGQYWARAWIWVGPPEQTAFSGPDGQFRFDNPVKGAKIVVARLPDWRVVAKERDPETGETMLAEFGKPMIRKVDLSGKPEQDQALRLEFKVDGK